MKILPPKGLPACVMASGAAFLTLQAPICHAQAPPLRWVQQAVATNCYGSALALDGTGNIYVAGSLYGIARFGVVTVNSGAGIDAALAKYDSSGKPLWATTAGGSDLNSYADAGKSLATDGAGNIYFAGSFLYSATFGNITISNETGNAYGVVAKLDASGHFVWVQALGAGEFLQAYGLAVDTAGNCYVTGMYGGQPTFGGTNLYSLGGGFVAKLNTNGVLLWAVQTGTDAFAIAVDSNRNVFVTGSVLSTTPLWGSTHTNLSSHASIDMFLAKYDGAGNFLWVSAFGNPAIYPGGFDCGYGVVAGNDGSAYVGGSEFGSGIRKSFVFKCSASGNLVWTRFGTGGDGTGPAATAISVDSSNSVYVLGDWVGTANFDGTVLTGSNSDRAFVGKYNSSGNLQWVNGFLEFSGSVSRIGVTSPGDNIYLTGGNTNGLFVVNLSTTTNPPPAWLLAGVNGQLAVGPQIFRGGLVTVTLASSFQNGFIGYSLDGSDPRLSSILYTGPFQVCQSALLQAVAYSSDFSAWVEMDPMQITILPALIVTTSGGGTVAIAPPSGPYSSNSVAQLTAQPTSDCTFLQWLGDASGTNPTTTVTMSRDKYVEAVFGTAVGTIVVGGGSVLADPSVPFHPFGTSVKFTAQPQAGNYFLQWGGAASGTNNPLNFAVSSAAPSVAGIFSALGGDQYALTVIENGRGHVLRSRLANTYTNGQTVTLTALPDAGQDFIEWGGDASGSQNPLSVMMNSSKVIIANFTKRPALRVDPPLNGLFEGSFRLTLMCEFGAAYQILSSTNLWDWTQAGTLTNTYGTSQLTDAGATNSPFRFYRAFLVQP